MNKLNEIIYPCNMKLINKEEMFYNYDIKYFIILKNKNYYHYYLDNEIKFSRKTNIFNLKKNIDIISIKLSMNVNSEKIKLIMNKIELISEGRLILIDRKKSKNYINIKMIFVGIINNLISNLLKKEKNILNFKMKKEKLKFKNCKMKLKRININEKITFENKEDCVNERKNHKFNKKFSNFKQFIYTAGDWEDVEKNIINKRLEIKKIDSYEYSQSKIKEKNIFYNSNEEFIIKNKKYLNSLLDNKLYKNIDDISFINTLKYMYYNIRNGVFIKIKDNELKMFVPFHNTKFKNNWDNYIKMDKMDIINYNRDKNNNFGRKYFMNYDKRNWVGDNCIISTTKYRNYKLVNAGALYVMLKELCNKRVIPDIEFFYNHRDYPILKKDLTEPYVDIYNDDNVKLKNHKYDKYMPIVGTSKRKNYLDILIPTSDDWEIINKSVNVGLCRDVYKNFKNPNMDWDEKIPTAIFRGAATNCGYDEKTSPRIRAHMMSNEWELDNNYNENNEIDGIKFLDAGVTYIWYDDIKKKGENRIKFIKNFETKQFVSMEDQAKYKYILNIDGSVTAYRLALELSYNSCILKVDSEYYTWYSHLLKEYVHYIPVKKDLSDLGEKIRWCKENDEKCKNIAENAKNFFNKFFTKDILFDYLQLMINEIKNN